jgi:hypothetical protein
MGGDNLRRNRPDADAPEPARLRQLRWMVNGLTATLILGVITVVVLLVIRLSALQPAPPPVLPPVLPDALALPPGETAQAVTLGTGWVAVVTRDTEGAERIRVFDAATGAERAAVPIGPAPD